MGNLFTDLQQAVADRLAADAYFSGPPTLATLTENVGDVVNAVDKALNETGLLAFVLTPRVQAGREWRRADVDVIVSVFEQVSLNRDPAVGSGKPAIDVAARVWALVDRWSPNDLWTPLLIQHVHLVEPAPTLIYEVAFATSTIIATV